MTSMNTGGRRVGALVVSCLVGGLAPWAFGMSAAHGVNNDRDGDGMPNRWETRHGLNPLVANAWGDKDADRLANITEYRRHSDPADEDTDGDGHDDGDEVRDGFPSTALLNDDTDGDGILDGDEDADRDGIDNEDEDDAREGCRRDDDDLDGDHVDDEDENEQGSSRGDSDSDDDGIEDGDEDFDGDGESNEDSDDADDDACEDDPSEDEGDVLGTITGFDSATGILTVESAALGTLTFAVTDETEIEFDDSDTEGSTADLVAGTVVAEVDVDSDTGGLEEIELYAQGAGAPEGSDA